MLPLLAGRSFVFTLKSCLSSYHTWIFHLLQLRPSLFCPYGTASGVACYTLSIGWQLNSQNRFRPLQIALLIIQTWFPSYFTYFLPKNYRTSPVPRLFIYISSPEQSGPKYGGPFLWSNVNPGLTKRRSAPFCYVCQLRTYIPTISKDSQVNV